MDRHIKESDWKLFSKLHRVALDRFCARVLMEVERINADTRKGYHERYLAIWRVLKQRDQELARAFNDKRRSTAVMQLAIIQAHDLLTEEELLQFSAATRDEVKSMLELWRG